MQYPTVGLRVLCVSVSAIVAVGDMGLADEDPYEPCILTSKGYLHLWDGPSGVPHDLLHGNGVRVKPVNDEMKATSTTTDR